MKRFFTWVPLLLAVCLIAPQRGAAEPKSNDLAALITPTVPADVDPSLNSKLVREGRLAEAKRLHNLHSWQTFVALNWPVGDNGRPLANLNSPGAPEWSHWSETFQIFKPDGSRPDPFGQPRRALPPVADGNDSTLEAGQTREHTVRALHNLSSLDHFNVLDEVDEAFAGPLWDQQGNLVHYETLVNRSAHDYIADNDLYYLQGQVAHITAGNTINYPAGKFKSGNVGAIEVKLAWRTLTENDVASRYLTSSAYVLRPAPPQWKKVTVGLVGFHISQKTESAPQRIWSTFEHVDNLQVDEYAASQGRGPSQPSFFDPTRPYLPVNIPPEVDTDGKRRTQVLRVSPIPKSVQSINRDMHDLLAQQNSPLQYYQLVDTQWPLQPSSPPAGPDEFPGSISNNSGGVPTPIYLINSVMETYFQGGINSRAADGTAISLPVTILQLGKPRKAVIPSKSGGNTPAFATPGSLSNRQELVFSTESCMSCHRPAEVAVSGSGLEPANYTFQKGIGDFSRIFRQARARKPAPSRP
jgi:hypothetical protein